MKIILKILNFLFPEKCSGCGDYGGNLCDNCFKKITERENNFLNLEKNLKNFEKIFAPFFYHKNPTLKKILKEIKYKNKFSKFSGLEEKIFFEFKNFLEILNKDEKILNKNIYLIPTPLHWKKFLKRGFNQSEIFCDFLEKNFKQKNISKLNLIKKIKNTKAQAESTKTERLENLKGAFEINKKSAEKILKKSKNYKNNKINENIFILIDDVLSTGSTFENCAIEIKKHFPEGKVFGFVICSDKK